MVSLDLSAASPFGLVLPTLGAYMDTDSGSLMVASSDGRDTRHASCDAHLSKARTDTRVVFNRHDAHTMRVWKQHVDATLDNKNLLHAATQPTLSFDDWAATHAHGIDDASERGVKMLLSMYHTYLAKQQQDTRAVTHTAVPEL